MKKTYALLLSFLVCSQLCATQESVKEIISSLRNGKKIEISTLRNNLNKEEKKHFITKYCVKMVKGKDLNKETYLKVRDGFNYVLNAPTYTVDEISKPFTPNSEVAQKINNDKNNIVWHSYLKILTNNHRMGNDFKKKSQYKSVRSPEQLIAKKDHYIYKKTFNKFIGKKYL